MRRFVLKQTKSLLLNIGRRSFPGSAQRATNFRRMPLMPFIRQLGNQNGNNYSRERMLYRDVWTVFCLALSAKQLLDYKDENILTNYLDWDESGSYPEEELNTVVGCLNTLCSGVNFSRSTAREFAIARHNYALALSQKDFRKNSEKILSLLEASLKKCPSEPAIMLSIAQYHMQHALLCRSFTEKKQCFSQAKMWFDKVAATLAQPDNIAHPQVQTQASYNNKYARFNARWGELLMTTDHYKEATTALTNAIKHDPNNGFAHYLLMKTNLLLQNYEQASSYYHKAKRLFAENPRSYPAEFSAEFDRIANEIPGIDNVNNKPNINNNGGSTVTASFSPNPSL